MGRPSELGPTITNPTCDRWGRRYFVTEDERGPSGDYELGEKLVNVGRDNAQLIGSKSWRNLAQHFPLLDIDYGAELVSSRTAGHFHLYLNKPVTWRQYKRLMRAMVKAGLLQKGYYEMSKKRGEAHLRVSKDHV